MVQPDFIFNATTSSNETLTTSSNETLTSSLNESLTTSSIETLTSSSNETLTTSVLLRHGDPFYFIGVGLCLYTAFAISMANIVQVIVSRLPNKGANNTSNHMMLGSGIQTGITFIYIGGGQKREIIS